MILFFVNDTLTSLLVISLNEAAIAIARIATCIIVYTQFRGKLPPWNSTLLIWSAIKFGNKYICFINEKHIAAIAPKWINLYSGKAIAINSIAKNNNAQIPITSGVWGTALLAMDVLYVVKNNILNTRPNKASASIR